MNVATPIVFEGVNHSFGQGPLRKQVLFDVSEELCSGEIVIVTGPSGSGKTTLLTLIGALRSAQEGTLRILGQELRGASPRTLARVRTQIGYVFQAHNLLDALSAGQNVEASLLLHPQMSRREARRKAREILGSVGLGDRYNAFPRELSGGQRQRVAVARALASRPRIILADEPTASLDRETGRDVIELVRDLARKDGVTVLLVTHDSRILDVADRILHLEDGRLYSFREAVMANTQHMMSLLAQSNRKGELSGKVSDMPVGCFVELLEQVTREAQEFLRVVELSNSEAFESMLEQALSAFTFKLGQILDAERASLFMVDEEKQELWLHVAQEEGGKPVEFRMPITAGVAGHVASTGRSARIDDASRDPHFNPNLDRITGFNTRSILCVPIRDSEGAVFAVAQLLNRRDGRPFDQDDEVTFRKLIDSVGVILDAWSRMRLRRR